jgi:hypothetical protein
LVKQPSFSVCAAVGRKNTSVFMSPARISPLSCSGESFQNEPVSVGWKSRTTSQSSFDRARRMSLEFDEPTVGFCPTQNMPLRPPSSALIIIE